MYKISDFFFSCVTLKTAWNVCLDRFLERQLSSDDGDCFPLEQVPPWRTSRDMLSFGPCLNFLSQIQKEHQFLWTVLVGKVLFSTLPKNQTNSSSAHLGHKSSWATYFSGQKRLGLSYLCGYECSISHRGKQPHIWVF